MDELRYVSEVLLTRTERLGNDALIQACRGLPDWPTGASGTLKMNMHEEMPVPGYRGLAEKEGVHFLKRTGSPRYIRKHAKSTSGVVSAGPSHCWKKRMRW